MIRERPTFVEAFFQVTSQQIYENLYFYYHDPSKIFYHLNNTGALDGELENIRKNLQKFIDEDDLFVNKKKIQMIINQIKLNYQMKKTEYPYLQFLIHSQRFQLSDKKLNEIHLYAKPETLPYHAISCWKTNDKIISVETESFHIINKNQVQLTFYLLEGEVIGGHEKIFIMVRKTSGNDS